jgi:hypothetical protein
MRVAKAASSPAMTESAPAVTGSEPGRDGVRLLLPQRFGQQL